MAAKILSEIIDLKETSFAINSMRNFVSIRYQTDSPLRYSFSDQRKQIRVFYYYNEEDLFDVDKELKTLQQFLETAKFEKNGWKAEPVIAVKRETFNYSDIYFKDSFRFMTRLDIIRNDDNMT